MILVLKNLFSLPNFLLGQEQERRVPPDGWSSSSPEEIFKLSPRERDQVFKGMLDYLSRKARDQGLEFPLMVGEVANLSEFEHLNSDKIKSLGRTFH